MQESEIELWAFWSHLYMSRQTTLWYAATNLWTSL